MQRARITYADLAASYDQRALLPYRAVAATEPFSKAMFLPWLVCNGYLTIKQIRPPIAYQPDQRTFRCGFPNTEAAQSLGWVFLQYAVDTQLIRVTLPHDLAAALATGAIVQIFKYLNELLSQLHSADLSAKDEASYRALIATAIQYCNYTVRSKRSHLEIELTDPDTAQVTQVYVLALKLMDKEHYSSETSRQLIEEAAQQLCAAPINRGPQVTGLVLVLYELTRQICAGSSIELHQASPSRDGSAAPLTLTHQPEA